MEEKGHIVNWCKHCYQVVSITSSEIKGRQENFTAECNSCLKKKNVEKMETKPIQTP